MKIPKINGSSIKNFFFYNVEKVILGISLLLLGVLFYLGMTSTKYDKTPDSLVTETKNASSFISKAANWELISEYRKGDTQVPERIAQASEPVDSSGYKVNGLSMIPKALQLRADPPLPVVTDLEAGVIRATIAVRLEDSKDFSDPLLELPLAMRQIDPDEEERKSARSMDSMEESMMGMADAMEAAMMGGPQPKKKKKEREKDKDPQLTAEPDGWHGMPGVQEAMAGGLRPKNIGISAGNSMAIKRNVVVVNALVEHRKLWKEQEQVLANSVAWYPKRDLPQYEFLQVEKRTIGADGKPSDWEDVSEWVNFDQSEFNPGSFISGPEVVAPENFDSNLTNAIPAVLGVDYASHVLHSKLSPRVFKEKEVEEKENAALEALEGKKTKDEDEDQRYDNFRNGGRRQKGSLVKSNSGGMGMGMGMGMGDMMSGMEDGMGMMGMFGSRGEGRTSMDMTAYAELTDPTLEPESDYKAVRFFDMRVSPNKPMKYEYRVRLWLKDPNATDPEATRGDLGDMGGMGAGMEEMMGGMGRRRGKKKDEKKIFQKTDINYTMQDERVRKRLKLLREDEDENGDPIFYVSEFYDGDDKPTEVQVPIGFDYLRFARPTKWSEPVAVTVGGSSPEFFADTVEAPRTAKVGSSEIPIEEPKVNVVVELENPELSGIEMAAKEKFSVGDLMNFSEPITIMHPVAQSVHFLEDANFETEATLVDVMGGEQLDLPKGEPMQYSLPGESLVMGPDGKFRVTNDIEQRALARHALRTPDEKSEYGKRKKKKKAKNPFGGMGGPDFEDMR